MKYVIVDLEATCEKIRNPEFISEIIEIGAVKVTERKIENKFNCFVKPTINPILSDFCKELTTITQEEVNNGKNRKEALTEFMKFCEDAIILSWGNYDKNQLYKECKKNDLPTRWLDKHINLKEQFAILKKMPRQCGMEKALRISHLDLDGTHHRGIDDATNITKIFLKHYNDWEFV